MLEKSNGPPAPTGEWLLGRDFVFVFSFIFFYIVYFESLGLPGFGCRLVMPNTIVGIRYLLLLFLCK